MARDLGRTPREVLRDPDLALITSTHRAYKAARRFRWGLTIQQAEDKLGAAIQLLYEAL